MKVGVFLRSANHPRFEQALNFFKEGVEASGDKAVLYDTHEFEPCDVAIFFGSWKSGDIPHHNLKREIVAEAQNFIVLETPLLGRQKVRQVMQDDWFRVGLNGFLADTGTFHRDAQYGPERWDKISEHLGLVLFEPNQRPEGPIIVALQLPGDASLRGTKIEDWCVQTCRDLRAVTERPVVVRLPQIERTWDPILNSLTDLTAVSFQRGSFENLIPTLRNAYCTVTYTSGLAIDSLLNGCPTITMNAGNFGYAISPRSPEAVPEITCPDREHWVWNLSHCQWHLSELREGSPWRQLRNLL